MLQKVTTTGVDLDSVYAQTLQRIREQKGDRSRLGMEVLMWVSHSQRPLSIGELCLALAVETGSTDLDPENVCPQDTILASSLGLVAVDETSEVRLIHYTLQEYLCLPSVLPDAHKTLGETCLAYLNYDQVRGLPTTKGPGLQGMPFVYYSSLYWGFHAKQGLSDGAKSLAVELLSLYENHISSTVFGSKLCSQGHHILVGCPFPGLHFASYWGIVWAVEALGKTKGCDINKIDCGGFTPLIWAAQRGNKEVVRLLLTRDDIEPDKSNNLGQTPLSKASFLGHESVVRLLLARDDVNPNTRDNLGRTPLLLAAERGDEGVVRLLLVRDDVNPDWRDRNGITPLWRATFGGHEGVVRLLLARGDVDPNTRDMLGRTPLWATYVKNHKEIRALLRPRITTPGILG